MDLANFVNLFCTLSYRRVLRAIPSFCFAAISISIKSCTILRINRSVYRCVSSSNIVLMTLHESRILYGSPIIEVAMTLSCGLLCNVDCTVVTAARTFWISWIAPLTDDDFNKSVSISAVCGVIAPVVESVPKLPYLAACADCGSSRKLVAVTIDDTKVARVDTCGCCAANNAEYRYTIRIIYSEWGQRSNEDRCNFG